MAIYWCDPYLNAPVDGIHGTLTSGTSSGDGSYAAPWSLTEITDSANYNSMSDGDELRFKGLSEDTFFPPSNVQTFKQGDQTTPFVAGTEYNGYFTASLYLNSSDGNSLIKIKQMDRGAVTGKVFYYKHFGSDWIRMFFNGSSWAPNLPPLDLSYGYIPIDSNYTCNINTNGQHLKAPTKRILITAGWTSETVQDGITVLDPASSGSFGSSSYWGPPEQYEQNYKLPVWDCGDTLIMARYNSSSSWYVYGAHIKLKAIADAASNYSDWAISSGTQYNADSTSILPNYNMGDVSIQTAVQCNVHVRSYGKNNAKHLTTAQIEMPFICWYGNTSEAVNTFSDSILTLKEIYGYGNNSIIPNNGYLALNLLNDWNFECNTSGYQYISFPNISSDSRNYIANNTVVGSQGSNYKSLAGPGWNSSNLTAFNLYPIQPHYYGIKGVNTSEFVVSGNGLFDKISYSDYYNVMGFIEQLKTNGVNLEETTISPLNFSTSFTYPWGERINVRHEGSRMLPVTLLQPSPGDGFAAMLYNSPNFGYKKAIRLFPECNGDVYADVVSYEIPSFAAESATYTAVYTTTSNPGVTIYDELYLYDTSLHYFVQIASITGSVDGTTVTCAYTLTSGDLANKGGQLIVIHRFDKTSADVAEVAYTNITIV